MSSRVDEQARERAFGAAYETSDPRENFDAGWDAALAAARPVSAQARERTLWTGRALFERFEHEAERGRGWPRLSKVGKHSWDALAEQIEGEVLAGPRGQDEQQLADAMTLLDRWLHKMGAVERENTRTMTEDFLAAAAVPPVPEDEWDGTHRTAGWTDVDALASWMHREWWHDEGSGPKCGICRERATQLLGFLGAAPAVPEDAGDERQPDLLAVEKLSRARGLAEAIMRVRDDDCGLREIAAEIVSLLAAVPSVAQAPTPEDERAYGQLLDLERRVLNLTEDLAERANTLGLTEGQYAAVMTRAERAARRALESALGSRASTKTEDRCFRCHRSGPLRFVPRELAAGGSYWECIGDCPAVAARPVTGTEEERNV